MMTEKFIESLKRALSVAEAQSAKAFEALKKECSEENQKAVTEAIMQVEDLRTQLAAAEAEAKGDPIHEERTLTLEEKESRDFISRLRDAIDVGTNHTFTVPTTVAAAIVKKRYDFSNLRRFCTVHPASNDYTITVEGNGVTVGYTAENAAITDSSPSLSRITLKAYKLTALVKISREALMDSAVSWTDYITTMIAKGFALKEDAEILTGTGSAQSHVTGVLTAHAAATTPKLVTAASKTAITWEEVKSCLSKLGAYKRDAIVVVNQAVADAIHSLKDTAGHYIFPQNEELRTIMGHRVVISPDMDGFGASKTILLAGDFSYYHIADRNGLNLTVLNELFAVNDQVGIKAVQRIDGNVSMMDAFATISTPA